ncbi:MAG TPA: transglutaminase domain-containing protein [Candidatus Dormibacteraeota bacterium]
MPQVNPGTVFLLLGALLVAGWLAGLLRIRYEDGLLTVSFRGSPRVALRFDLRDLFALLAFALVMGWAVAGAVEHSDWLPGTEGRLVPAMAFATAAGFVFASLRFSRLGYLLGSIPVILLGLVLFTPSPLSNAPSIPALTKWVSDLPGDSNLQVLIGFLVMCLASGLWTGWWLFTRKNGLVALLPTGTILAVEIINDTSLGLIFYTIVWLAAAACLLLRINFVTLKQSWRRRRLPHASDTGWTFGEIGAEATAAILVVAFILPPLSNADISGALIPAVVRPDSLHPFGIGAPGSAGSIGTIGYSDVVRPGSQLKAKSETVMVVTGDTPLNSPYWRGIALGGWDGIQWYSLPSTSDVPVRVQPQVRSGATIPRDDIPSDTTHSTLLQNTFRMVVPQDQTKGAIFSAGEARSVRNLSITVQGIMTSVPGPSGAAPSLVNVPGDNAPPATFDTIDRMQLTRAVSPPYVYTVSEVVPNADIADLQSAGTDYPAWLAPYTTLYYGERVANGYAINRDAEILALARSIVSDAHATTPYDQAKAIESWFRQKDRFSYTLVPPRSPAGVRPLDYFLFTSRKGFCQDFSTAMNVMLRMLGIPSRQMSGFGLGSYDDKLRQYDVNSLDAHSWVEVYFPGYGWIPFEPTPDNSNFPISLPANRNQLNNGTSASAAATPRVRPNVKEPGADANINSSAGSPFPDLTRPLLIAAGVLLLLLLLGLLIAIRWLFGARDLPRIWNRLLFLADRLKVPRRSGDTPVEFGGRLSGSMPELEAEVRRLSTLYTRASFRRGGLSPDELAEARQAWLRVRSRYAGLVARAWRDALRQGRVVSAAAAESSENPKAAAPR